MKKKKTIVLVFVAVLLLSLGVVFAESVNETPEWYNGMIEWKRAQINEAVENEEITEEQAKYWNERIDAMQEYHKENGFNFPMGCCGFGRGRRQSFGRGVKGGFSRFNRSSEDGL